MAKRCFGLSPKDMKRLVVFHGVPREDMRGFRNRRFVGVRSAKRLGLEVHGSEQVLRQYLDMERELGLYDSVYYNFQHLQSTPLEPLRMDPLMVPTMGFEGDNEYHGVASIRFPSLFQNRMGNQWQVERGLWCRGCEWVCEQDWRGR
jgi:hypothetical protein